MSKTVTLYPPTGPKELELVANSGFRRWPPRLPNRPIFHPATTEQYATEIARDGNVPASGSGFVTHSRVRKDFIVRYPMQVVGSKRRTEWWIPAGDLESMNDAIEGLMKVIHAFDDSGPVTTDKN